MNNLALVIQAGVVFGVAVFAYLILIRPQLQREASHQGFLASLRVGDMIVTQGGLVGQIVLIDAGTVLEIELCTAVRVRALKTTIDRRFES